MYNSSKILIFEILLYLYLTININPKIIFISSYWSGKLSLAQGPGPVAPH